SQFVNSPQSEAASAQANTAPLLSSGSSGTPLSIPTPETVTCHTQHGRSSGTTWCGTPNSVSSLPPCSPGSSCQDLAQTTHLHTTTEKRRKPLLEHARQRGQRVKADTH